MNSPSYIALRETINHILPDRVNKDHISIGCEVQNLEQGGTEIVVKTNLDMPKPEVYTDKTWPHYQANYRFTGGNYLEGYVYKILGKPLEIGDVLRALGEEYGLTGGGELASITYGIDAVYFVGCKFNLSLPLSAPENAAACEAVRKLLDNEKV